MNYLRANGRFEDAIAAARRWWQEHIDDRENSPSAEAWRSRVNHLIKGLQQEARQFAGENTPPVRRSIESEWDRMQAELQRLEAEGRYGECIALLRRFASEHLDPADSSPEIELWRQRVTEELGRLEQLAQPGHERGPAALLETDPETAEALKRATALAEEGRYGEAIAVLRDRAASTEGRTTERLHDGMISIAARAASRKLQEAADLQRASDLGQALRRWQEAMQLIVDEQVLREQFLVLRLWGVSNLPPVPEEGEACQSCAGKQTRECGRCGGSGRRLAECGRCSGSGSIPCSRCEGNGQYAHRNPTGRLEVWATVRCRTCRGGGQATCPACSGTGEERSFRGLRMPCARCNRSGRVRCNRCDGTGREGGFAVLRRCREGRVHDEASGRDLTCNEVGNGFRDRQGRIDGEKAYVLNGSLISEDDFNRIVEDYRLCRSGTIRCPDCRQRGSVACPECRGQGRWPVHCDDCAGTGRWPCFDCGAAGRVSDWRRTLTSLPPEARSHFAASFQNGHREAIAAYQARERRQEQLSQVRRRLDELRRSIGLEFYDNFLVDCPNCDPGTANPCEWCGGAGRMRAADDSSLHRRLEEYYRLQREEAELRAALGAPAENR